MNWCERCQPLVLDHLYGLLDGPDAAFVEAHLRECASCAATRDEAARCGALRPGGAGRVPSGSLRDPRVRAGTVERAGHARRALAAASTGRSWRVNAWLPWAVAAAVWLAIPGTVLPVLNILHRADRTQADADRSMSQLEPKIAEADKARLAIDEPRNAAGGATWPRAAQHLDAVLAKWLNTESEALARARRSPVDVLNRPPLQPGAPNEFDVFVHDGLAGGHTQLTAKIHEVRGTGANPPPTRSSLSQPLKAHHYEAQPLRFRPARGGS